MAGRRFVGTVLALGLLGCGSAAKNKDTATTTKYTWAADIAPVVSTSCGGSGGGSNCHDAASTGAAATGWVGNEAGFTADEANIKARLGLAATDTLHMPRAPRTISATDQQKILDFLNQ